MKKLVLTILGIFTLYPLFGQDPNILIGLNAPAYGVKIKANFPGYNGGWSRWYSFGNQDNSQTFFGLGALGEAVNGISSFTYGWIGRDYNQTFMSFLANGNVGIGTTAPESKLAVAGNIELTYGANRYVKIGSASNYYYNLQTTGDDFQIIEAGDANKIRFHIDYPNGNVGIGTTTPQSKLAVNGTITTKEVNVTLDGWADFVFHPTYKLRTLAEVEQFIKANSHLPEIPTEAEVKANGVSLGEMNAKLLQKVEELTLYMIEQKKEIDGLKQEVKILKNK